MLDSKIELLNRLLLEISSADEVSAVSQKLTALINIKPEKFSQIYNNFQITHEDNQNVTQRLEQKKEEVFKKMNTNTVHFIINQVYRII